MSWTIFFFFHEWIYYGVTVLVFIDKAISVTIIYRVLLCIGNLHIHILKGWYSDIL